MADGQTETPTQGGEASRGAEGVVITGGDRERAFRALGWHESWGLSDLNSEDRNEVEDIAAALAEERERERLVWNPMIGRVIQLAQKWALSGDPVLAVCGQQIHDAIRGDQ